MKNKNLKLAILFLAVVFVLVGNSALAQWTPGQPIVPCGGPGQPACTKCEILHLVRNVIDFLMIGAAPVLATAFFIWAGVYLILGGANPGMLSQGKSMFQNTLIGLLIVMLAWLITNTVIQTIAKPNIVGSGGSWWTVTCSDIGL